jgi:hypothetical protein
MLRFSESNPSLFTSTAGAEPFRRWARILALVLREHARSHRAAAEAAQPRRGLAALRRLYLPPERAERSATTLKFETAAADERRKFRPDYFSSTPARHSFGR